MPLEDLVNNLPSMVGYWDKNLCNVYCNKAYEIFFNLSPNEIKGKHIRHVIGETLYEKNLPYLLGVLNGETQSFTRDIPVASGDIRHTQADYLPVFDEKNEVKGFYVLVTDVTQLKKIEKEKEELYQRLIQNSKMIVLGEMAGGIAHEINNPLSIISMNANILTEMLEQDSYDDEKAKKMLSIIQSTSNRIAKIVNGLLHFAREQTNESITRATLKSIIDDALSFCFEKLKKRNIDVIVEPYDEGLELRCSPVQISQVLLNLIHNSAEAMDSSPEKRLLININERTNFVDISVSDTGKGIDPDIADKIMQPFFTTKEAGKGVGLGLSIAKGIVEKHKGQLKLTSNAKNTTFVISLPKLLREY